VDLFAADFRTSKIISYVNKTLELAALAARTNQPCAHA